MVILSNPYNPLLNLEDSSVLIEFKIPSRKWNWTLSPTSFFRSKISFHFTVYHRKNSRRSRKNWTDSCMNGCQVWWRRIYWCVSNDVGRLITADTWPAVFTYQLLTITFALFICEKMDWLRHAEFFPCPLVSCLYQQYRDVSSASLSIFSSLERDWLLQLLQCSLHFTLLLIQFWRNTDVTTLLLIVFYRIFLTTILLLTSIWSQNYSPRTSLVRDSRKRLWIYYYLFLLPRRKHKSRQVSRSKQGKTTFMWHTECLLQLTLSVSHL